MRKTVFIVSHIGSGYDVLLSTLLRNPRIIQIPNICRNFYKNLLDIINASAEFKFHNQATNFIDCNLFNHMFSAYDAFNICSFIFLINEPKQSLQEITKYKKESSLLSCQRYYLYRLRRICEIAKRTPQAVFLTNKDLYKPETYNLLENHLNLRENLEIPTPKADYLSIDSLPQDVLDATESAYEKYFYFLKQQNLKFVN